MICFTRFQLGITIMITDLNEAVIVIFYYRNIRIILHIGSIKVSCSTLIQYTNEKSDVRNFGAIIRTAECTGVDGIIIQKKGGAPVNGDTIKTSAGAVFKMPICKVDHIKDAVFYMQASGIKVVAATEKTDNTLYDVSFKEPCAIIMGSEDRGINPSTLKIVDTKAKLPLLGDIQSLNVSVACGAFLYEAVRQRLTIDD